MAIRPGIKEWLAQVQEEIVEPDRPIIDPHHHLLTPKKYEYLLEDFWGDTQSGHKVEKTVFLECSDSYFEHGPEHLRPVGETVFVEKIAAETAKADGKAEIAGIISRADLRLEEGLFQEVLNAHEVAGKGRFRGIRHGGAHHPYPDEAFIPGTYPKDLFTNPHCQARVRQLGQQGLSYEAWMYHFQIKDFIHMAQAAPETTIIFDHLGTPLGTKSFIDQLEANFPQWKKDVADLAKCPNVYAKLGGMAMPDNGYGWDKADRPPTSDEFIAVQQKYYMHAIECFGVERCMFESNFPVDKYSLSYHVLWNAFKKMVMEFSEEEKQLLFYGVASKVYRI